MANQFLKDKHIEIEPYYELDALEAIEKLVQQEMGVSLVPQWAGLDLNSSSLDAEFVRPNRYARRIVLVSPIDSARQRIITVLNQALLTPLA